MKKYVKPELFYEKFELSKHIAADCAWEFQSADENSCIANPDQSKIPFDYSLFTESISCSVGKHTGYESYCYQSGSDGVNVFKS